MTATFDARIDVDDLHDHFMTTPIHDQVERDLRSVWIQQPTVTDVEFDRAVYAAMNLAKPHPATPDLFDDLAAAIDQAPAPSGWDKLEDWLTFEWHSWMGWALCLLLGGVFAFIGWAWLVSA